MSKRDDRLLLQDMAEGVGRILRYTSGKTFDEWLNDEFLQDAVIRNFEVVGELAATYRMNSRERIRSWIGRASVISGTCWCMSTSALIRALCGRSSSMICPRSAKCSGSSLRARMAPQKIMQRDEGLDLIEGEAAEVGGGRHVR